MNSTRNIVNCLFCLGLILSNTLAFNFSYAAEPKRIALLPFEIKADEDLLFLKEGIFHMLTSRLSKSDQVEVLSKAPVEAATQSILKSGTINKTGAQRIGGMPPVLAERILCSGRHFQNVGKIDQPKKLVISYYDTCNWGNLQINISPVDN